MENSNKSSKASRKSQKLDELSQLHGKNDSYEPTTLDQIWGDSGLNKYGTVDHGQYMKELDEMSRTDINAHAINLGIIPVEDRTRLEERLSQEFNKHVNSYRKPAISNKENSHLAAKVKKLLEE